MLLTLLERLASKERIFILISLSLLEALSLTVRLGVITFLIDFSKEDKSSKELINVERLAKLLPTFLKCSIKRLLV